MSSVLIIALHTWYSNLNLSVGYEDPVHALPVMRREAERVAVVPGEVIRDLHAALELQTGGHTGNFVDRNYSIRKMKECCIHTVYTLQNKPVVHSCLCDVHCVRMRRVGTYKGSYAYTLSRSAAVCSIVLGVRTMYLCLMFYFLSTF